MSQPSWVGQLFLDGLIFSSDLCTCGTFVSLAMMLRKEKSAAGLSLQTLTTIVGARTLHFVSHFIGLHFIPAVMPWIIFPTLDVINALAGATLLFCFFAVYYKTYERNKDNFGIQLFVKLKLLPETGPLRESPAVAAVFLYGVITALAFIWYYFRRSVHNSFWMSYFCCFYEVMGAVALLPQLWMFHSTNKVSSLLANLVVLTAFNRLCTLLFWISYPRVYLYRYPDNRGIQMASECLNLLILSDFLFYWARSKWRGEKEVILPEWTSNV